MSRRESRASIGPRQNDALYEFETFKKRFLLANKHITKLNSTLSVRIEELNAQLHALNVENLRLRTSEIQLASELKREKEKSRKVMADAEAATHSLTRHLNYLRTTLDIPRSAPVALTPPSPKARHRPLPPDPTVDPASSPQGPPRIARPPAVPGIHEDEEPSETEDNEPNPSPPPKRKSKTKPRLSASNLPLPTNRISTPPPQPLPPSSSNDSSNNVLKVDLSVAVASSAGAFSKRKPTRRQSGLLTVSATPLRPPSPAFGSPVRLQAGRAELQDEIDVVDAEGDHDGVTLARKDSSSKRKAKGKEHLSTPAPAPPKDRKRRREDDDSNIVAVEAITTKLKPHGAIGRAALQPIDNTIHDPYDDLVSHAAKQFLNVNQRGSLTPSPEPEGSAEAAGRERRARKSVNYAEPKLNTKMRRPDSAPGLVEPRKKRTSAAAVMSSRESSENPELELLPEQQQQPPPPPNTQPSPPGDSNGVTTLRRKKSRPQSYHIDEDEEDESDGADDEEYAPSSGKKAWSNINLDGRRKIPGRRGSGGESDGRRHSLAV